MGLTELNQRVSRAFLLLEPPGENLFPCLFQLLRLLTCLASNGGSVTLLLPSSIDKELSLIKPTWISQDNPHPHLKIFNHAEKSLCPVG